MSEPYTPTTNEVREAYVEGVHPEVTERYRAEFDRWLAEVKTLAFNDGARSQAEFNANVIRAARAEAWDEGWEACHAFMGRGIFPPRPNPYRNGADQ